MKNSPLEEARRMFIEATKKLNLPQNQ